MNAANRKRPAELITDGMSAMINDLTSLKVKPVVANGTETSVISNLIAAFILFMPNLLMLLPTIREAGYGFFIFFNFVLTFILVSGVSHFKFWRA
jgi:hypothetical protein